MSSNFKIQPAECESCFDSQINNLEINFEDIFGVVPDPNIGKLNDEEYKLMTNYVKSISVQNKYSQGSFRFYNYTVNPGDQADYAGGTYSPTQNRIYFPPLFALNPPINNWDYIDCDTGQMVKYPNNSGQPITLGQTYAGGCLCHDKNRIYFAPRNQSSVGVWHYIDCNTGNVVAYNTPILVPLAYAGNCFCPGLNRIYFAPSDQSIASSTWHYLECDTNTLIGYQGVSGLPPQAYGDGCFSPKEGKIYFVPSNFTTGPFHYINCNTGALGTYQNNTGVPIVSDLSMSGIGAYASGVYSPLENKIYFMPAYMGGSSFLHYIDCNTGTLQTYANSPNMSAGQTLLGSYVPTLNRIFLSPFFGADTNPTRFYIDCYTGEMKEFTDNSVGTLSNIPYEGSVFSPLNNRLYFVPFGQYNLGTSQFLNIPVGTITSPDFMALSMFNNL